MGVIYKIKRFTRAEKAAWKDFYKKTYKIVTDKNGNVVQRLNVLPSSKNPRDAVRFNKLAVDLGNLSRGDKKIFDRENAKTLLNNVGLSKLSGQLDHMVDKYTNKRALARLARIKDINPNYGSTVNKDKDKINKILIKLNNRGFDQKKYGKNKMDLLEDLIKSNPKIQNQLIKESHRLGVPVGRTPLLFAEDYNNYYKFHPNEIYGDPHQSSFQRYVKKDRREPVKIQLGRKANDSTLAHEIGHARSYLSSAPTKNNGIGKSTNEDPFIHPDWGSWGLGKRSKGKRLIRGGNRLFVNISNDLSRLAEENSANAYGGALFKKVNRRLGIKDNGEMEALAISNKINYSGDVLSGITKKIYDHIN